MPSDAVWLEAAKQVPNLVVLAVIVWQFLRALGTQTRNHREVAEQFAEVASRSAEVIGANTEALRRLNGSAHEPPLHSFR